MTTDDVLEGLPQGLLDQDGREFFLELVRGADVRGWTLTNPNELERLQALESARLIEVDWRDYRIDLASGRAKSGPLVCTITALGLAAAEALTRDD
jgi:hypothetical protein